jgi:hypothetical protein
MAECILSMFLVCVSMLQIVLVVCLYLVLISVFLGLVTNRMVIHW